MLEAIKCTFRPLLLLVAGLAIVGCGGDDNGGASSDPPPPNSSGSRVTIGPATWRGFAQVVIDDSGNALAVWQSQAFPDASYVWSRSAAHASWTSPRALAGSPSGHRPILRGASDGQAVLYDNELELARFTGSDWVAIPAVKDGFAGFGGPSDPLLQDGTFPALKATSGMLHLAVQLGAEPWAIRADISPAPDRPDMALAVSRTDPMGTTAKAVWDQLELANGESIARLRLASVDLQSSQVSAVTTLTHPFHIVRCGFGISAATGGDITVISRPTVREDAGGCDLLLTRYDHLTSNDQTDKLNASGYQLATTPPILIMDGRGNALVIWDEDEGVRTRDRARWSQSLEGGSWSAPQPLPAPAGLEGITASGATLAMNAAGQAVLVALAGPADSVTRSAVRARFSFTNGWSDWSVISGSEVSNVDVAINAQGEAIAIYEEASNVHVVRF